MTERLYYADPYRTRFTARVVERFAGEGGQPTVVLNRSAFYPTGGGQPHDSGTLNGAPVLDVVERESDEAVLHVLDRSLEGDEVVGQVDWDRRFDLMQQHSGQHVLSAAFARLLGATTVGFHLSGEYSTIDLNQAPLEVDSLAAVEVLANQILHENRPVVTRFVDDEELAVLPLRKPVKHGGPIRVMEIPGFECTGCGGTHVRATGEIGLIKVTRIERRGTETRVEFLAGRRALADYGAKNQLLLGLAQEFTVGYWEVSDLVHRLADELRETRRELRLTRDAMLEMQAGALRREAVCVGPVRVVRAHFDEYSPDDLKHLAQRLAAEPETVALLATGRSPDEKGAFTFARSESVDVHMGTVLRRACEAIGGRGGGRPEFAQGGAAQGDRVAEALGEAFRTVLGLLEMPGTSGAAGPG